MLKKVEGIIVSSINYGETSKIINILTKDLEAATLLKEEMQYLDLKEEISRLLTEKETYKSDNRHSSLR